jgi:hypothetical protein
MRESEKSYRIFSTRSWNYGVVIMIERQFTRRL